MTATAAVTSHVRRAIAELAQLDGFSTSIGGLVSAGGKRLVLSELHGMRGEGLRDAVVSPGVGLGGKVLQLRRPAMVEDYVQANTITHQFDRAVMEDSILGAVAVPVTVSRGIRAVIYGASRQRGSIAERTVSTAVMLARRLAHDITVEEEIQRRLAAIKAEEAARARRLLSPHEMAEVNAELVAIAGTVSDPEVRERLLTLSDRFTGGFAGMATRAPTLLSRREFDVLAHVAAGHTNAEVAQRLAILPTTVKTHLKHTMRKLGARNRVEAVTAARHAGLLP